jgi:glycosyltransferase involved in cell wall biosynthesis
MTRRFPPSVGGMERYAFDLYTSLTKRPDAKVSLVKWGGKNKWLHVAMLPVFFVWGFWVLVTQKIDVIHAHDGVMSVVGYALKFIFRKPLVVVLHGLDITYTNSLFKLIVPRAVAKADRVICISSATREEAVKRGIDPARVVVITLGVDDVLFMNDKQAARRRLIDELKLNHDAQILLSVGRLVKRKGIAWFVSEVMPEIVRKFPKTVLLISGDGDERQAIEQATIKNNLSAHVKLLGRTSDEMRRNLYNGADVFVMPNISVPGDMEGFGLVLTEAATCELPIVAAGIEGIKDAVKDGENGYLVASKDKKAFVSKIGSLLADPKNAQTLGRKARTYTLDNYQWSAIAGQFIEEYHKLSRKR